MKKCNCALKVELLIGDISCVPHVVHLGPLYKVSIVFLRYISHCNTLTHMCCEACCTDPPLPSLLSHISLAGWPDLLWQVGAFKCSIVSVCVSWAGQTGPGCDHCIKAAAHRSPFSLTGCHCLFRLLRGFTCWRPAGVELLQPSRKSRMCMGAPVNFKLWGRPCYYFLPHCRN